MLEFEDLACIPVSVSKQPLVLFQYLSHFSSSRLRSFDGTLASILTITNFFLGRTNILRTLIPTCVIRKRKWKKIYKKKKNIPNFPSNHRAHESIYLPSKKKFVPSTCSTKLSIKFRSISCPALYEPGHDSSNARNDRHNEIAAGEG